jgi:hypothetical protein
MSRMNRTVGWLVGFAALAAPACIVVPAPATVGGATNGLEYGVNRPGYDYKNFELSADPVQCQAACYAEPECQSFTYLSPGVQGPTAHCWLKNAVAPAVADGNCTSGVKVAYAPQPAPAPSRNNLEYDTNRFGSDYNNFEVPSGDPAVCQDACLRDASCAAFTLVRPGVQGPNARCWLKNNVPPPAHDTCCTSGTK